MRYTDVKVISPKKAMNTNVHYYVGADYMAAYVRIIGIRRCRTFIPRVEKFVTKCESIDKARAEYNSINAETLKYSV